MVVGSNNEPLFRRVYEEYADAIFRFCWFRLFDREEAADAMQEVFFRFWKYLEEGHIVENHKAFLYKVATNHLINLYRKKKPISLDELREEGFDVGFDETESRVNILDGKRALERLDKLDPKYREVIFLRFVEGLGPREIADLNGESENVVSVRLNRALKKLKELMNINENES